MPSLCIYRLYELAYARGGHWLISEVAQGWLPYIAVELAVNRCSVTDGPSLFFATVCMLHCGCPTDVSSVLVRPRYKDAARGNSRGTGSANISQALVQASLARATGGIAGLGVGLNNSELGVCRQALVRNCIIQPRCRRGNEIDLARKTAKPIYHRLCEQRNITHILPSSIIHALREGMVSCFSVSVRTVAPLLPCCVGWRTSAGKQSNLRLSGKGIVEGRCGWSVPTENVRGSHYVMYFLYAQQSLSFDFDISYKEQHHVI